MEFGYARVSAKKQNAERQLVALTAFGIKTDAVFVDKQSGKDFERTQYRRLIRKLKGGDTLVVKSIDRLRKNSGAAAYHHERKTCRNCGAGYDAAGYQAKPRFDRLADCRYCSCSF